METVMKSHVSRLAKKAILLFSLSLVAAGASIGPASADDWHHDGDRYRHEEREHWRHAEWERRHYYVPPPVYVVPPPRAVYVPPPVMVVPPQAPGLSIVVPLTIR